MEYKLFTYLVRQYKLSTDIKQVEAKMSHFKVISWPYLNYCYF